MVWCARESADYLPSKAMNLDPYYGWIHWDSTTKAWHTVTDYELGRPDSRTPVPTPQAVPTAQALPATQTVRPRRSLLSAGGRIIQMPQASGYTGPGHFTLPDVFPESRPQKVPQEETGQQENGKEQAP
jgi:hypothetical protein